MERKLKASSADTRTIDIQDEYALEFWAMEFNVTLAKLRAALMQVGNSAADVKRWLKK